MMNRKNATLLAIYLAEGKGLSPVQIQKTLFLLGKEMPQAVAADFYQFKPYNFGPFDRAVYSDAEQLAKDGEIEIKQRPGENWNRYVISQDGAIRASYLAREVPQTATYLETLVEWVQRQTFEGLITAIYEKYPEMRANSVFQG